MKAWYGLLMALLLTAPAMAQVGAWSDAAGDTTVTYNPTSDGSTRREIPNDAGWYPNLDIIRAGVYDETEHSLLFEMVVTSRSGSLTDPDPINEMDYYLYFTFHGESMRLRLYAQQFGDFTYSYVERLEGEYWQYLAWAHSYEHPDAEGWIMEVSKWSLRDRDFIPAREGDTLSDFWATSGRSSWSWYDGGPIPRPLGFTSIYMGCTSTEPDDGVFDSDPCGVQAHDEAGNADSPLGDYTLTVAPENLGNILIESIRPIRYSNGLATTYVYRLNLYNLVDEPDSVSLAATSIPSGWDIYLPPRVDLEPKETKELRIAVGVPFGHKHGEYESVIIRAKSSTDAESTSETAIYVEWPVVAQPSGHHPRVYFHADGWRQWFDTTDEHPDDDGSGVMPPWYSDSCYLCPGDAEQPVEHRSGEYRWSMYLRPGLFTGLDFEVGKAIEGNLEMATRATMETTVITEMILYRRGMEPLVLGTQEQTVQFQAGQATSVPVSMPVPEAADRIPYETNSGINFHVTVIADGEEIGEESFDQFQANDLDYFAQIFTANSFLDLPLLDYHDDVDPGLLDDLTRLQLEAPEEVVRPANPGKTIAYYFEVINKGTEADVVEWSIEGPKADWAQVVPGTTKVGGEDKATVAIRIDVPQDAIPDEVADLLLVGQSTRDVDAQVFGNFQVYVTTEADIPDESDRFLELQTDAEETEARGTPFPAAVAMMAVLLVAMVRRRIV